MRPFLLLLLLVSVVTSSTLLATEDTKPLQQAFNTVEKTHNLSLQSQQHINKLSAETQKLLQAYQILNRNTQYQLAYQDELRQTIQSQHTEQQSIRHKIESVKATQQQIMPLIYEMTDSLASFVELDLPFNLAQRRTEIKTLQSLINNSQASLPEKFQALLKHFQTENDYGNNAQGYQGKLTDESEREVKYLRIGRLALYYQTLNGLEYGFWHHKKKSWQLVPITYHGDMKKAFKIANNKVVPTTMLLPIIAPLHRPNNEAL